VTPSPSGTKGLLMPDPIRTGLVLPPALLDDPEPGAEGKVISTGSTCDDASTSISETRPGMPLKRDPYGRDAPRRCEVKAAWSAEPLTKYLKSVVTQITTNLQDKRLPTAEKLETFITRLVANTQRQLKHAPRKVRHALQATFTRLFQKYWNFARNEKVRATTPEELKCTLVSLVEALTEFASNPDAVAQPKPVRCVQHNRGLDAA